MYQNEKNRIKLLPANLNQQHLKMKYDEKTTISLNILVMRGVLTSLTVCCVGEFGENSPIKIYPSTQRLDYSIAKPSVYTTVKPPVYITA